MSAGPGVDGEAIRALVREVLAELLPATAQPGLAHAVTEHVESV